MAHKARRCGVGIPVGTAGCGVGIPVGSPGCSSCHSLHPLRCKFPTALKMKKSAATPLEFTLTKKCLGKFFGMHSYKFKRLKLPWNDILTKNRGGVGSSVRSGKRGKFGEELVARIARQLCRGRRWRGLRIMDHHPKTLAAESAAARGDLHLQLGPQLRQQHSHFQFPSGHNLKRSSCCGWTLASAHMHEWHCVSARDRDGPWLRAAARVSWRRRGRRSAARRAPTGRSGIRRNECG